jgi:dolichol kinase
MMGQQIIFGQLSLALERAWTWRFPFLWLGSRNLHSNALKMVKRSSCKNIMIARLAHMKGTHWPKISIWRKNFLLSKLFFVFFIFNFWEFLAREGHVETFTVAAHMSKSLSHYYWNCQIIHNVKLTGWVSHYTTKYYTIILKNIIYRIFV